MQLYPFKVNYFIFLAILANFGHFGHFAVFFMKSGIFANEEKNESKREEDQYQPPLGLLDFIPLSELCNSILSR